MTSTPYIVALTGGIASGKSTVEQLFAKLGVCIIDADKIAQNVVEKGKPALNKLISHFGSAIVNNTGQLNRAYLRKIIFNLPQERQWVNQLLHPIIERESQKQMAYCHGSYLIWVVPLLIETNLQDRANRVLLVESNQLTQLERLKKRDKIDENLAKNMLLSQVTNTIRRNYADDIIENNGEIGTLNERVFELHQKYLDLAKNSNTTRAQ